MYRYRILSADGGGSRGLVSAKLLERLVTKDPNLIIKTKLFAGTSTGSFIALGLAYGMEPKDLTNLYLNNVKDIFKDSWLNEIVTLGSLVGPDYDNTKLKSILEDIFGDTRLGDLKKHVLIPTFDLDSKNCYRQWKPKFFHNLDPDDKDMEERLVDVAMRSSAAPIYFPSYGRYVDGGLVCNSPSMAAIAQALDSQTGRGPENLEDITLLSLGTGFIPEYIEGENLKWGLARWARKLVSIFMNGATQVANYQAKRLLNDRYHRVEVELDYPYKLDEVKNLDKLIGLAKNKDLTETYKWISTKY